MLLKQKHPSYGITKDGEWVALDRWSETWSALELYELGTAEELGALRVTREGYRVERATKAWVEDYPLLALADITLEDAERREGSRGLR